MKWDAIQRGAQAKGVLVYAIDQSQTAPMTQPGPWGSAQSGYCIGLGANWISLAYQGKDFPYSGQVCDDPPWQATMAQTIDDNAGFNGWENEWKLVTEQFSCTISSLKAQRTGTPSAAFICQVVFNAYGCYGVTLRSATGGHAVTMRNGRDGRLHLFDPNYFHVAVKSPSKFQDIVSWWLSQTGYDTTYTSLTGVIGVRPPINHSHP